VSTNRDRRRRLLVLGLVLAGGVLLLTAGGEADPVSAVRRPKPTPTPTRPTPTPTSPTATPAPGPTTPVDGNWNVVPSPNVGSGTYGNRLNAVAIVSPNDVWAVGFSPTPGGPAYVRKSLIEHWDGTDWRVVPSPNPAASDDVELNGVVAVSANDVWAVGHSGNVCCVPYQTLIEHWDGMSWSIVPSPSPGTYSGNDLHAVVAISASDVWAVGEAYSGQYGQDGGSLILHWDGTSWSVVPNASKATLLGASAVSANDVWAVGSEILHWNGATWSIVQYPAVPSSSILRAVSAVSANDIWAVGFRNAFYGSDETIAVHWDGSSWTLVPDAGDRGALYAVDAIATNDVWAVGSWFDPAVGTVFLTEHWNGAAWTAVAAPNPGGSAFNGVAAVSARDVWAVGSFYPSGTASTLIERYTVP
jgi:hypothetical protein